MTSPIQNPGWRSLPGREVDVILVDEFCNLIGEDCLSLFIIFGVPGKPEDLRGVVLDSVKSEPVKDSPPGGKAVARVVLETEDCVSIRELVGNCMSKKRRAERGGQVLY